MSECIVDLPNIKLDQLDVPVLAHLLRSVSYRVRPAVAQVKSDLAADSQASQLYSLV